MRNLFICFVFIFCCFGANAQQISYSQPEPDDIRTLDFEIIGKVSGNFLVYKNLRNKFAISIYDNDMQSKDKVDMDFMPDKAINVDFVAFPNYAYVIYQFQKRNVLHCMAAEINGTGRLIKPPFELDTTRLNFFADNKIYNTIFSEDKSKIMVYKIQKRNDKFNFKTLLFDDSLRLLHTSTIETPFVDHVDGFSDFFVDNSGNFLFTKATRLNTRDYIQKLTLITKAPNDEDFTQHDLDLSDKYLDEIKLKVDNVNQQYLINSLFYKRRNGNIDGLYTAVWDKKNDKLVSQNFAVFNDSIRALAKSEGGNKYAFNDFFIKDVILRKDGGFILTAEDHTTQNRGNPWSRYDYLYGNPYYSPYNSYYLYSPSPYGYPGQYNSFYNGQVRYFFSNILVLDLDKSGSLIWNNVVHKSQFDDNNDSYLSYSIMLTGGQLHFLFNELERRNQLINDQTVSADGALTRNPPLRSLDRGYEFMPKYGKQVSSYQTIIPCTNRNYICFAKIEY
jgi:hypothetical protein